MRVALWLLGLFALAVAFTLAARLDQGYVIIVYPPWRLELSFMLALTLTVVGYALGYLFLKLALTALALPTDLRAWRDQRRSEAADRALIEAMRAHLGGDHERTRKLAAKAQGSRAPDLAQRLAEVAVRGPQAGADWKSNESE